MWDACEAMCNLLCELGPSIDGGKDSLSMAAKVSCIRCCHFFMQLYATSMSFTY